MTEYEKKSIELQQEQLEVQKETNTLLKGIKSYAGCILVLQGTLIGGLAIAVVLLGFLLAK